MAETNDNNERRLIRRNTSNQIVSYTLPQNSVTQYGLVKIPAQKDALNKEQFENAIDTKNVEFTSTVPDLGLSILALNSISLPTFSAIRYKWNGEIIRVGDFPGGSSYYYIEDGIYHKLVGNGVFSFLAEKLKKPLAFRIDSSYDYDTNEIDFGQNQFAIYENNTYSRQTEGYLDSFEEGEDITTSNIMLNGISAIQIRLINQYIDTTNPQLSIDAGGSNSTRARWLINPTISIRDIIASVGDELKVRFVFTTSSTNKIFQLNLNYGDTTTVVNIGSGLVNRTENNTIHLFTIDGVYITPDLESITILKGTVYPPPPPPQIAVPNVSGLPTSTAVTILQVAGFNASANTTTQGATELNNGRVGFTTPSAGTSRPIGSTVTYLVYNYIAPPPNQGGSTNPNGGAGTGGAPGSGNQGGGPGSGNQDPP